jgi:outer membrane protein assembly factor BamA
MIRYIGLTLFILLTGSVRAVEFDGNRLFSDKELRRSVNTDSSIKSISHQIESLYQKSGYFSARVTTITQNQQGIKTIYIEEEQPSKIDSINIIVIPSDIHIHLDDLLDRLKGSIASGENLDDFAAACINRLVENGFPYASGQWLDFGFDTTSSMTAVFRMTAGPLTYISGVVFRGLKRTRPETIQRALNINLGDKYVEKEIRESEQFINQMPYLRIAGPTRLESTSNGDSCKVLFDTRELPSTKFDGAAGLARTNGKSIFIGRLNLEFGDLFGTGRSFGFLWNRKDRYSSQLRLSYLEPYIFNSKFDLKLEVFQNDKDSLYIENGGQAELSHLFGGGLKGSFYVAIQRTVPETDSRISRSIGRSLGLLFDFDNTDNPDNPHSGYGITSDITYKYRSNQGESSDSVSLPKKLTSAELQLRYFMGLSRQFVAAIHLIGWGIIESDGNIPGDELKYLGGFENLRGYSEGRFPAFRYALATIEPRLIAGPLSRVYLFLNMAEIESSDLPGSKFQFYPGYGLGAVAPSTLGQFKIEIGWGKNGFPSEAFVNFGLAGRF